MSGSEIWLIERSKLAIDTGVFASLSLKLRRERQICWCRGEGSRRHCGRYTTIGDINWILHPLRVIPMAF